MYCRTEDLELQCDAAPQPAGHLHTRMRQSMDDYREATPNLYYFATAASSSEAHCLDVDAPTPLPLRAASTSASCWIQSSAALDDAALGRAGTPSVNDEGFGTKGSLVASSPTRPFDCVQLPMTDSVGAYLVASSSSSKGLIYTQNNDVDDTLLLYPAENPTSLHFVVRIESVTTAVTFALRCPHPACTSATRFTRKCGLNKHYRFHFRHYF